MAALPLTGSSGITGRCHPRSLPPASFRQPRHRLAGKCTTREHPGGLAIAVSGAALAVGRRWGFLLLAIAMIFAATAPWIIQGLGLTRYPYERAGSMETFVFLALSLPAVWGYFRHRSRAADA